MQAVQCGSRAKGCLPEWLAGCGPSLSLSLSHTHTHTHARTGGAAAGASGSAAGPTAAQQELMARMAERLEALEAGHKWVGCVCVWGGGAAVRGGRIHGLQVADGARTQHSPKSYRLGRPSQTRDSCASQTRCGESPGGVGCGAHIHTNTQFPLLLCRRAVERPQEELGVTCTHTHTNLTAVPQACCREAPGRVGRGVCGAERGAACGGPPDGRAGERAAAAADGG